MGVIFYFILFHFISLCLLYYTLMLWVIIILHRFLILFKLSNNDIGSNFLNEQNQNCSRPQSFAKVTYHGFFKCEGKCYPNTQLELCWKILSLTIFY